MAASSSTVPSDSSVLHDNERHASRIAALWHHNLLTWRRVLKNCATHHCKREDWDWDYHGDEGEEGELPVGDEVQGWRPVYGAVMLLGFVATAGWFAYQVYVVAQRNSRNSPTARRTFSDDVPPSSRRIECASSHTTEYARLQ